MPSDTSTPGKGIGRRQFLATLSGGLVLGFVLPHVSRFEQIAASADATTGSSTIYLPDIQSATGPENLIEATSAPTVNAWIVIKSDETITILVGSSEMGQGIISSLPQILAEDLMVDWTRVRAVHAPAAKAYRNPGWGMQATGGSMSVRGYYTALRVAGATAREMLIAAAAQTFGLPASSCQAVNGTVVVKGSSQVRTYGQLAALAASMPIPKNPPLVPDNALRLIGKSVPRLDLPSKVDGSAQFGIDVRVPGMVYAAIKHCPSIGGTVASIPAAPAGTIAVVSLGNAVAVVADNTWKAMRAARSLRVQWSIPGSTAAINSQTIATQATNLMANGAALMAESEGDAQVALTGSAKTIDVTYSLPYVAHGCMEPLNCTVSITSTRCDVWAPTQSQEAVANVAVAMTGLKANQVQVHTTFLGGGLGRKGELDFVIQAIRVAQAVQKPVKLTWSREEDFGHDYYRPMALVRVRAGLDASGNVTAWMLRNVSPSILGQRGWNPAGTVDSQAVDGALGLSYHFVNRLAEWVEHPSAVPVGFWRSVGNSINGFAVECAIDELASATGSDPLAFRQKLLAADSRSLAVLDAAAKLGGWSTPLPAGHARGIALVWCFNSIVAQVVEISQPQAAGVKVHSVACVVDCGKVINPDTIEAQIQGGIVQALTTALWSQVTFNNGVASARNFDDYRMLRMREMPRVSVRILQSGVALGGIGEVGVPALAPALANAYFRLTGTRMRSLPMFPGAGGEGGDN